MNNIIGKLKIIYLIEKFKFLLFWVYWFYPKAKSLEVAYLLNRFFVQKVLRVNGRIPWPVHPTSRVLYHKNIILGNRSFPGNNIACYIQGRSGIHIGNNCRFGPGVGLISANHSLDIGDNVWLGMNAVVMPGVCIGNNVIIGSNSVVTKDIPSNCIAVGKPCKVLKNKNPYVGKKYEEVL